MNDEQVQCLMAAIVHTHGKWVVDYADPKVSAECAEVAVSLFRATKKLCNATDADLAAITKARMERDVYA